jgi:hypothetical protein
MRRALLLLSLLGLACLDFTKLKDCTGDWYCADFEDGGFMHASVKVIATHAQADTVSVGPIGHDSASALNLDVPFIAGGATEWALEWEPLPDSPGRDWYMRAFVWLPRAHDDHGPIVLSAYRSSQHEGSVRLLLRGTTLLTDGDANGSPPTTLKLG